MNLLTKLKYHNTLVTLTQILLIEEMLKYFLKFKDCHLEKTNNHLFVKAYKSDVKKNPICEKTCSCKNKD
jgi:hypothetical protein